MEGRKTKHAIAREILHYILMAIIVGLAIASYVYKAEISNYFAKDLTKYKIVNKILRFTPKVILSLQIVVLACVINFVLKILAMLGFGLTAKGKTIINLVNSLLKWIVIICAALWILSVWGVNTKALLAGAGILALIIGLGAQSLIADILAGIFIVFEGKYVVGDIVVIEGWRGKIVSIGIRTTELKDIGGNIKIINNSEIKSVINQTKLMSVANCYINVTSALALEDVENIIAQALPEIRTNIPAITADIEYMGITEVTDITTKLLYRARCYEEDIFQVQRDLHRHLKLVLDKNNIPSFAPPTYVIKNDKTK